MGRSDNESAEMFFVTITADKERIIMDRESDPNAYDHVTCFAETV